jgi:hypothetical protein
MGYPRCVDQLYNQKICINYMVRTQLIYFHTEQYTQLHVSALYIGHRQVVLQT